MIENKISIALVINKSVKHKKNHFNLEMEYLEKAIDFFLLLKLRVRKLVKVSVKTWKENIARNFLIMLNNLQQMHSRTTSKRVIQKTAEETGDLIGNKISDRNTTLSNE